MQERWNELQDILEELKTMKKREYMLTLAVCVLSGLVVGMLISPKKRVMIGSNNGSNNINTLDEDELFDYCEEECCCEE
ncbi:hypothetical protein [Kineothrix sp. MB12-C1]|uniref:hypothetical protein n=1 Tax=Kineothrix sp. MB12-C1 TaxID=3070215 RepID=UPI0027D257E8|nr:hypothetical protein [Kineothrix sp. MB12-C1]WMC93524.1 hypothetical protein RBB56_04370 [Kineothrix sp. MB12-C1]